MAIDTISPNLPGLDLSLSDTQKAAFNAAVAAANAAAGVVGELPLLAAARRSLVGTNTMHANLKSTQPTAKSTTFDYARDDIDGRIEVEIGNFYVPSGGPETAIGAPAASTYSLEFPPFSGNRVQLTQADGNPTITIPDGGRASGFANVKMPRGMPRLWREARNCSAGIPYNSGYSPSGGLFIAGHLGEAGQFGPAVGDHTMSGPEPTDYLNGIMRPLGIYAQTRRASAVFINDSIGWGDGDTRDDASGDLGFLARAIGHLMAYTKMGMPGEKAANWVNSHAQRLAIALAANPTHLIIQLGRNDITSSNAATILANLVTIANYFPASVKKYVCTVTPNPTSTDNWATVANQTVEANKVAVVDALNNSLIALPAPFVKCFDVATALSSGRSSGKWAADLASTPFWMTKEGLHPTQRAHKLAAQTVRL